VSGVRSGRRERIPPSRHTTRHRRATTQPTGPLTLSGRSSPREPRRSPRTPSRSRSRLVLPSPRAAQRLRPDFGSIHRHFGSYFDPVDSIYESEGSKPPPFDPTHEPASSFTAPFDPTSPPSEELLLARVRATNASVRIVLAAGSSPPHFGLIFPRPSASLARSGSRHARAGSIDGRFGSVHEPDGRGHRAIPSTFLRSVRRRLGPVRSLLPSILSSLRTGARRLRRVRFVLTLVRFSLPRRASRQPPRTESPRAGSCDRRAGGEALRPGSCDRPARGGSLRPVR
jgi:hypothetical protein